MFDSVRVSVAKAEVREARKASHALVGVLKMGWRGGLAEEKMRQARAAHMSAAREVLRRPKKVRV